MGAVSDKMMEFLHTGGYYLGYDEWNMPKLEDIREVSKKEIPVWDYFGKTEEEYYGRGDKW